MEPIQPQEWMVKVLPRLAGIDLYAPCVEELLHGLVGDGVRLEAEPDRGVGEAVVANAEPVRLAWVEVMDGVLG